MIKKILLICALVMTAIGVSAQKKVMFDLSHGQFQDTFVDSSYYDYVIPEYERIAREGGYTLVMNKSEITGQALGGIDALLILSPLAKSTQKNLTETRNGLSEIISNEEVRSFCLSTRSSIV